MNPILNESRPEIVAIRAIDPRERTSEQHKVIQELHQAVLTVHYDKHGVGDTVKHKLAYWESNCPNGYSISHNPTDEQKVAVFEACWVCDNYPQDSILC